MIEIHSGQSITDVSCAQAQELRLDTVMRAGYRNCGNQWQPTGDIQTIEMNEVEGVVVERGLDFSAKLPASVIEENVWLARHHTFQVNLNSPGERPFGGNRYRVENSGKFCSQRRRRACPRCVVRLVVTTGERHKCDVESPLQLKQDVIGAIRYAAVGRVG